MNMTMFSNFIRKVFIDKQKYYKIINKLCDEKIGVKRIEMFSKFFLILISENFDDYTNRKRKLIRTVYSIISRLIFFLIVIKYLILSINSSQTIRFITNDSTHLMGNSSLISMTLFSCMFTQLMFGLYIQYKEFNHSFEVLNFFNDLKFGLNSVGLNCLDRRKFGFKISLITIYSFYIFNPIVTVLFAIIMCYSSVISYLDPNNGNNLFIFIFWLIINILLSIYSISLTAFILVIWYLINSFLDTKFNKINKTILFSVKTGDTPKLLDCIKQHNCVTIFTQKMNSFFNTFIFIAYYFGTPSLLLVLYNTHEKSSILYVRIVCLVIFLSEFSLIFLINYMSAKFSKSAQKTIRLFYTFLNRNWISLRDRLEIQLFIERLYGPPIGFYCLDLFPMNNYEFYQFVSVTFTNYFLVISNL